MGKKEKHVSDGLHHAIKIIITVVRRLLFVSFCCRLHITPFYPLFIKPGRISKIILLELLGLLRCAPMCVRVSSQKCGQATIWVAFALASLKPCGKCISETCSHPTTESALLTNSPHSQRTMASAQLTAKTERERRLKSIISECHISLPTAGYSRLAAFATHLRKRFEDDRDTSLLDDIQVQVRCLPLSYSSAVSSRQDELDKLGTELWNLSTRLRRDILGVDGKLQEDQVRKKLSVCFLRVFSFFLLDSAGYHPKSRQRKGCTRLMKVALKAAKVCIENKELGHATKVLERAAEYQEVLSQEVRDAPGEEHELAARLQLEYFAVRTALVGDRAMTPNVSLHFHADV